MRHIFIINPVAGKKDAGAHLMPAIRQASEACGIAPEFLQTNAPRHAQQLAQQLAAEGPVRLYSVGGDGTLNEIFNGVYMAGQPAALRAEIACIPCGSGNDFVRSFGTPEDFMDLANLIRGQAISVDLMQVDSGVCAAITSTGLDAEVAYNIPKYRRIPLLGGPMAYNISIVEKLLRPLGKQLDIYIDGKRFFGKYLIAAVCNGQTYGGGYRAAPMASLSDGVLDVILMKKVSRVRIATIIGKYKQGLHYQNDAIIPAFADAMSYHTAREVEIVPAGTEPFILNVDGECGPAKRLYAKVLPGATRFVLPASLYASLH